LAATVDRLARRLSDLLSQEEDPLLVFRIADRLIRTSTPDAISWLARAQALKRLSTDPVAQKAARASIEVAFGIDPTDPLIAAAVLDWGPDGLKAQAAQAIVQSRRSSLSALDLALQALLAKEHTAVAQIDFLQCGWSGWVATKDGVARPTIVEEDTILKLDLDPAHPLTNEDRTISSLSWPDQTEPPSLPPLRAADGQAIQAIISSSDARRSLDRQTPDDTSALDENRCAVIVPVYADLKMTKRCLDALAQDVDALTDVFVVNDNPKAAALRSMLRRVTETHGFRLIENEANLGFVRSINRALEFVQGTDVLLLNSDALLAPGAIGRLKAAAYSAADIGTVTPLTNNGELTNWPHQLASTPLGSARAHREIDQAAREINDGRVVDLPNGVGFCLLIRARCLRQIGRLHEAYLRGYLEDVDLCLRARELGWRNVCATNVFVVHQGTVSFKSEKRTLYLKNRRVLVRRFPTIGLETRAFIEADPLRAARARLDGHARPRVKGGRLIIARTRQDSAFLARVGRLGGLKLNVFSLTTDGWHACAPFTLRHEGGSAPQSLSFRLDDEASIGALLRRFETLKITKVERLWDVDLPDGFLRALAAKGLPLRGLVDAYPFSPKPTRRDASCDAGVAEGASEGACAACMDNLPIKLPTDPRLTGDERPIALSRMAKALFARGNNQQSPSPPRAADPIEPATYAPPMRSDARGLAIVNSLPSAETEAFVREIARDKRRLQDKRELVILGACLDDAAVMSYPFTHVTGPVDPAEISDLLNIFRIGLIVSPQRWGGFAAFDELADTTGLLHVYFDWSFGAMTPRPFGFGLDPRMCDRRAAARILDLARRHLASDEAMPRTMRG
jgi:GT2 family glycosyltransferase